MIVLQMWSAERGMRNVNVDFVAPHDLSFLFGIPRSTFRIWEGGHGG